MPSTSPGADSDLMHVLKHEAFKASADDLIDVEKQYVREKQWYAGVERYQNYSQIQSAVTSGRLRSVLPHQGAYHMPQRFVNPQAHHLFPPYLAPHAHSALEELSVLFKRAVVSYGIEDDVRISVTSMVRSQEYQNEIVNNGQLALPESTHTAGGAFDVQSKGYFLMREGTMYAVNTIEPAKSASISGAFRKAYGDMGASHERAPIEWFDERVCHAIEDAVNKMALWGLVNKVNEFVGTSNQCFHVGVNPEFE